MRGKGIVYVLISEPFRITPAYAGKSAGLCRRCPRVKDHPRACGEKIFLVFLAMSAVGLPPHMRGKAQPVRARVCGDGITPAHAGKRCFWYSWQCPPWDHPRTCGEKTDGGLHLHKASGSPPHMRGKDKKDPVAPCLLRLLYCVFLQFAINLPDHARHLVHLSSLRA